MPGSFREDRRDVALCASRRFAPVRLGAPVHRAADQYHRDDRRSEVDRESLGLARLDCAGAFLDDGGFGLSRARLDRIKQWQNEINLSVLALSAGEETLPQLRQQLGRLAPRRRVR